MTSYRQMRRHARRVRRSGLQPIMVINPDGQFPVPAAVILARWAWRYRSELAPAYSAGAVLGVSWWLHATHPHWWTYLLACSAATACALVMFGARVGLARLAERIYASTAAFAAGASLASGAYSARSPHRSRKSSAPARSSSRFRGGRTAAAGPRSACSGRSPPGQTSPGRSACPAPR
jgi:hypothetical protein